MQQLESSAVDPVVDALLRVGRILKQRTPGDPVEPGSLWLLRHLAGPGSLRVTELAAAAGLDTSTVSRHVSHLLQAGLVERGPDPQDRRAQRVTLTDHGTQMLAESARRRRALLTRNLRQWQPSELDQLQHLLARFVADVENTDKNVESV